MITPTSRGTKRIAAAAVAVVGSVLAISGTAVAGPGAAAPTAERLSGDNRYGTAADVANEIADVSTITVANGEVEFGGADGLASAHLDNAILLTEADALPPETVAWLDANDAEVANIQIVGETTAVSAAVEAELAAYGTVTRLGGPNRYDTAVEIAESESPETTEIIIARGDDFPDALASGPLSIEADAPIILNAGATLRSEVTTYLDANDQITSAYIVGGETVIPSTVEAELVAMGIAVERLGGSNRDATAVEVANELITNFVGYDDGVIIANRLKFADAMVAGRLGGERTLPILLVSETALPAATETYLVDNCLTIAEIVAVGGNMVIDDSTIQDAVDAATCAGNQSFVVMSTPAGAQSLEATPNPDTDATDDRSFTVGGLGVDEEYRISLVVCENVTTNANGDTVFAEDAMTGLALTGAPTADIVTVNGAPAQNNMGNGTAFTANNPAASGSAVVVVPAGGVITFTIDGDGAECVVPVVYNNGGDGGEGGDSPRLELNADGTPSEEFGVGDETTFTVTPA